MKKLLVTGASGFLGWNLCQQAHKLRRTICGTVSSRTKVQSSLDLDNWEVHGTYFSHAVVIPNVTIYKVDLTDYVALKQLFKQIQPDAVIHTAAASKPNFCQVNWEAAYAINVDAAVNIVHLCSDRHIPCAFTSTDLVFDGKKPLYKEADSVCPINHYGEQKAIAEQKMSEIYPQVALCRMPLMFGLPSPVASSFLQGMVSNLQAGKKISLFSDEYRTPASGQAASQGLLLAIEQQVRGILHLGGCERISRYEFGLLLADVLNLNSDAIASIKQADVIMVAPRSPDTSLDSTKAFGLGYQPLSLNEELANISSQLLSS